MPRYEYKIVPAPSKGLKGKNVKGAEARFSHALQELMNGLSGYGWEYQRAETLPSIERVGLAGSTTEWRNVLVFRRPREADADAFSPELLPAPAEPDPAIAKKVEIASTPQAHAKFTADENGTEDPDDVDSKGADVLTTLATKPKSDIDAAASDPDPAKPAKEKAADAKSDG